MEGSFSSFDRLCRSPFSHTYQFFDQTAQEFVFSPLCTVTYEPSRNKAYTIKHKPLLTPTAQLVKPFMFTSFFIASHRHVN